MSRSGFRCIAPRSSGTSFRRSIRLRLVSGTAGKVSRNMQIPVVVEPIGGKQFRAQSVPPFTAVAEAGTSDEAISKIRAELKKEVEGGKRIVMIEIGAKEENPLLAMAGWLKDDPLF